MTSGSNEQVFHARRSHPKGCAFLRSHIGRVARSVVRALESRRPSSLASASACNSTAVVELRLIALNLVLLGLSPTAFAEPGSEQMEIAKAAVSVALASEDASTATPLHVLEHSSFPRQAHALEQLKTAATQGYCGMDPAISMELFERLIANNSGRVTWRTTLRDPRIAWVQAPHEDLDFVGLSVPVVYNGGHSAIIGMDMSGASGVLMLMRKAGDQWALTDQCVEWTSWR